MDSRGDRQEIENERDRRRKRNEWGMEFARFASRLLASTYSLCPSSVVSFSQSLIKVQLQVKLKHDNVAVEVKKKERTGEKGSAKERRNWRSLSLSPLFMYPFLLLLLLLLLPLPLLPVTELKQLRSDRLEPFANSSKEFYRELLNARTTTLSCVHRPPTCVSFLSHYSEIFMIARAIVCAN